VKRLSPVRERAIVYPAGAVLTRKPWGVRREFPVICPDHGRVIVIDLNGHHLDHPECAVGYEVSEGEEWRMISIAVSDDGRRSSKKNVRPAKGEG
jgi:hypothetical protein